MSSSHNTPLVKSDIDTDFEIRSEDKIPNASVPDRPVWYNLNYFVAGILFGILLVKSEVISWFRIQEMFRSQSFHMYGVIGSAVMVGMVSVFLIKRLKLKSMTGEPITFPTKPFHKGNIFGGLLFGFGWALTGASWAVVRSDRNRRNSYCSYPSKRDRRHVDVWQVVSPSSALIDCWGKSLQQRDS